MGDIDPGDGRNETADQRADRNWNELLQELRVIQTGTQIISGFLLTVAFQPLFPRLDVVDRAVYGVLVGLAAVSTILGLAIVALHRTRFRQHDKPAIVTASNRMLRVVIAAVAILSVGVVLLIFDVVFGRIPGLIAGVIALVMAAVLLLVVPRRWHAHGVRAS